ncbi:hypothetical protein AGMMS49579_24710 [Spirochaetia bacterium]|nr:hypothetical protein AGMMS49579_24710 [Spirochaetia bacterium]
MELGYTYWKDDGWYVGHLDEYSDYTTQGETKEEFEEMLRSLELFDNQPGSRTSPLYKDITTFAFPFIKQHGKLKIV